MPKPNPRTELTTQNIQNLSFDDDFDVLAVEVLGYFAGSSSLQRMAVDTDGHVQVDILSGAGGTQYTEGDTDSTITGTALMFESNTGTNTISAVSNTTPLPVSDAGSSLTVDNGGTFVTQENGAALTALQLIDDVIATLGTTTYAEATTKGATIGAVRRDADTTLVNSTNEIGPLQMDANGRLKVEVFSGETLPVSLTSTTITGTVAVTQSGTWDEIGINDSGNVITVDGSGSAGTAATGVVTVQGIASMTPVQVGDNSASLSVDWNGTQPVTGSGNATGALRVELANNGTGLISTVSTVSALGTGTTGPMKAEDVGHSTGDMGIPAWGVRQDSPNATAAATGDYHYLATDMVGGIRTALYETDFAVLGTKHVKKYYTNAGAVTDGIVWSPAAGTRWYVTDLIINTSAATTVTLEDDKAGGDEVVMKLELAANSGVTHHFGTPLFSGEDAADLIVTTSAGNIYITITGYEI